MTLIPIKIWRVLQSKGFFSVFFTSVCFMIRRKYIKKHHQIVSVLIWHRTLFPDFSPTRFPQRLFSNKIVFPTLNSTSFELSIRICFYRKASFQTWILIDLYSECVYKAEGTFICVRRHRARLCIHMNALPRVWVISRILLTQHDQGNC